MVKGKIYLLIVFLFMNCIANQPFYLIKQGKEQFKLILNRKNIQKMIDDPSIDENTKRNLLRIQEIKSFAKDYLRLKVDNQYIYYNDISGDAISYIVIACEKLSLKAKSYWFPIVGEIYYLGFFEEKDAKTYAEYLKSKNFDVKISKVQAYSTLGWFSDPIFSYHLKYLEEDLVRLLFHELTHNTFWLKNNNEFNENLADFIEVQGVIKYYEIKYKDEKQTKINLFLNRLEEEKKLSEIFFEYKNKLNQVYKNDLYSEQEKLKLKEEIINELKQKFQDNLFGFKTINTNHLAKKNYNNADFVLLGLYHNPEINNQLSIILSDCQHNYQCFWEVLKNKYK